MKLELKHKFKFRNIHIGISKFNSNGLTILAVSEIDEKDGETIYNPSIHRFDFISNKENSLIIKGATEYYIDLSIYSWVILDNLNILFSEELIKDAAYEMDTNTFEIKEIFSQQVSSIEETKKNGIFKFRSERKDIYFDYNNKKIIENFELDIEESNFKLSKEEEDLEKYTQKIYKDESHRGMLIDGFCKNDKYISFLTNSLYDEFGFSYPPPPHIVTYSRKDKSMVSEVFEQDITLSETLSSKKIIQYSKLSKYIISIFSSTYGVSSYNLIYDIKTGKRVAFNKDAKASYYNEELGMLGYYDPEDSYYKIFELIED